MFAVCRMTLHLIAVVSMALSGCASTGEKLQAAAEEGDAGRVARLLKADADTDPSVALDNAARAGHADIVRILLDAGADPSSGLDDAAGAGHTEVVRILLGAGARPSDALDDAVRAGHAKIVRILLEAGARPSHALDDAAGAGRIEIVRILLEAGADPSRGLEDAARAGHIEIVRVLLEAGAVASRGFSTAAGAGHTEIVRILLEAGADPSVGLPAAAGSGRTEIVSILLGAGGDPNAHRSIHRSRLSLTPLHLAAWRGHQEVAGLLIEAGADIEAPARYKAPGPGETFASIFFSSLIPFASADDLLKTDLEGKDSWTPLQFAAAAGHTEIVKFLTEASAFIAAPAGAGYTTGKPARLTGDYIGGLRIALDGRGTVTGRYESYGIGIGTVEQPQFSCIFSFFGFPASDGEEYVIASWDPPVWRPDATLEEGINTTGTLRVAEDAVIIRFVEDPSGGCWNVVPFTQGFRFGMLERRAWIQVRVIARDARLFVSPGGAAMPEPLLERGDLALVLEERDDWLLVTVGTADPVPQDGSPQPVSRYRGWLREPALFPISPPGAPGRSELVRPSGSHD